MHSPFLPAPEHSEPLLRAMAQHVRNERAFAVLLESSIVHRHDPRRAYILS